ncbi:MAG TPA: tRNA (adenosine(37)-N6)-dimethylallyltransferase MiaA [Saprospiraceae bacterium]|nr:tRNA (adenosine(37)-N6)-dimethylallyltransferase MiaA [Saprospiraceae bacterium]
MIIIAGPTAVGKTSCAMAVAIKYHCDIISADSRQIYREMTIGTAKPSLSELALVKHHFVDFLPPDAHYNAGKFEKEVTDFLEDYFCHHDVCVMTGGTGLYINAVIDGLDHFPEVPWEIQEKVKIMWKEQGITFLQEQLKSFDPEYYCKVDLQNPHRLIRAISVSLSTGQAYSSFLNKAKKTLPFEPVFILLQRDRHELYQRIDQRVDQMIDHGLVNEVRALQAFRHCQSMQTVGYRELSDHFEVLVTLESAIDKIKQNSRRYAKRQLTWFNNDGRYTHFHPDHFKEITDWIDKKLQT